MDNTVYMVLYIRALFESRDSEGIILNFYRNEFVFIGKTLEIEKFSQF